MTRVRVMNTIIRKFSNQVSISPKDFYVVFILLVDAFAWFYMAPMIADGILESMRLPEPEAMMMRDLAGMIYYVGIIVTSFLCLFLFKKIDRLKFIYA
ncbi:MAG: hypothetical protein P8X87_06500, partial [Candidatus Bathyarchaeota archaeon]